MRILFVLKDRFYNKSSSKSYGLMNSSKQVALYLEKIGHECEIVQVVDGNGIDKVVYEYKPDMVIIEALWVTGDKIKELMEIPRYRHIKWVIRVHSDIGFLSAETLALAYINDYIQLKKDNLYVSCNNLEFNYYLSKTLQYNFTYLPNIIELKFKEPENVYKNHIDIGCFGSLRILKNQCYQAMCAIEAADKLGKQLKFHISVDIGMTESNSRFPVLKNLEEMFENSPHELVKHYWLENSDFHILINKMDIGLQLSYTESFNIVAADFVNQGVPIIVSDAIKWMPFFLKTSTVDYHKTIKKIVKVYKWRNLGIFKRWSRRNLVVYNETAKTDWLFFIHHFEHHNH
jgi:hypothetical protein